MRTIKAEIEIITPFFLSGEDQEHAELRPPSVKGLLRFWWRAMKAENNLSETRRNEQKIFGGTENQGKKSSFSVKIIPDNVKTTWEEFPRHLVPVEGKNFGMNILGYLAYGPYDKGKLVRDYYSPGTKFDVYLLIKEEEFIKDILHSLYLLSSFGGLGSRARNGFGNFHILNRDEVFKELGDEYVQNLVPDRKIMSQYLKLQRQPPYTAFSEGVRLFKSDHTFDKWDGCLAEIGEIYRKCRLGLEKKHQYEKRQYIGAPIIVRGKGQVSLLDRRAKPYFMRVIKEKESQLRGYILYLPAKYSEESDKAQDATKVWGEFNKLLENKLEVLYGK